MMKVLITGDLHNEFKTLNKLIARQRPDMVICCGDFGYWPKFTFDWAEPLSNIKLGTAKKLLWCDGNHEDFWSLKERKSDELAPNVIYMPRGSTYTLPDGRIILFMGGATSIDKSSRRIGLDWFPEEMITQSDFFNLPDCKVDIFITHTCPLELVEDMKTFPSLKNKEPSNFALSQLWNIYKPDLWFFGHWHRYKHMKLQDTNCYALSTPGFGDKWWMWLS